MNRLRQGFFALLTLLAGVGVLQTGTWRRGLPAPRWAGWPLVLLGAFLLARALVGSEPTPPPEPKARICPSCDEPFGPREARKGLCPRCKVPLEPLEGYYQRHPEKKEKE